MKYFIFLMISMSLIGCQSAPPSINVFQLSQGPQSAVVNFDATQLLVERIELVDYLKQNNIIFEHNYGELTATKYQLWAEPINKGIARTLVNNINAEQNVIRADSSEFTTCRIKTACYRVTIFVEKFYPSFDSSVKFSGKYKLYLNETLIEQQDFNLQETLTQDGYPHTVESLTLLVGQLGKIITKRLSPQL